MKKIKHEKPSLITTIQATTTKLAQKMNDKKVMNTQLLFIDNIENVNPASILC